MSMDVPSIPGYEGLKSIGKGGFSRVFEATQQKFRRQVAIKVLNFGVNDEENRRAFARETQVMGRVSTHPNIVTVYDTAFTDHGQPCIVMELCSGGTIAERIQHSGALPPDDVVDVGFAIASALQASHDVGVLHRDIKPQNILISDFGQPALSDFGISAFDDDRAQTGDASGFTLHYAAPEVIEGDMATVQSDVYSLAATLYTAAAGQRPFATPGTKLRPGELARRVLLEEPESLTTWGVPAGIDAVILRALSKDPADRHPTAQDFAGALSEARARLDTRLRSKTSSGREGAEGSKAAATPVSDEAAAGRGTDWVDGRNDPTDGTVLRRDFEGARRSSDAARGNGTEEGATAVPDATVGKPRRWMAVVLPMLALLVVGGVLFALGDAGDAETAAPDPTPVAAAAVDPIRAPEVPSAVVLERPAAGEVLVRWESLDAGDPSVTYEVRRSDIDAPVATTVETEHLLTGIADNEQPCVRIVALRGSRVSNESEPICAQLASIWVEVFPDTCAVTSCTVRLRVVGLADGSDVTLQVTDPTGNDLNGFAPDAYGTNAELNADGDVVDWRLKLGTQLDTGRYRVQVSDDVGIAAVGFFTVTE